MPLYEYQCNECGPFSAIRKMSESHLAAVCDNCGGTGERVISAPNFALLDKGHRQAHERNENPPMNPGY